jgi:hypothetical protein
MTQIAVTFSVENDGQGLSHVTYRSFLGSGRVGGRFLPQYSGRRRDMDTLCAEMQINYGKVEGGKYGKERAFNWGSHRQRWRTFRQSAGSRVPAH